MQYIVMDLEWNGGYSRKAHGYFNEIIEVGAVRLDESLQVTDRFHAAIRPVVSRKLSEIVTDLTNITPEELEDGVTFDDMMQQLAAFVRRAPAAVLTWSTTDLLVLMENCRFSIKSRKFPFCSTIWMRRCMCSAALAQRAASSLDWPGPVSCWVSRRTGCRCTVRWMTAC